MPQLSIVSDISSSNRHNIDEISFQLALVLNALFITDYIWEFINEGYI